MSLTEDHPDYIDTEKLYSAATQLQMGACWLQGEVGGGGRDSKNVGDDVTKGSRTTVRMHSSIKVMAGSNSVATMATTLVV